MKLKKWITISSLFFLAMVNNSCSEGDQALTATTPTSPSFVIPTTVSSCLDKRNSAVTGDALAKSVSESYFQVKDVKLLYNRSGFTFTLVLIKIRIKSQFLTSTISCDIAGDELASLTFNESNAAATLTAWDGVINPASNTNRAVNGEVTFTCPLTCGGLKVDDKNFTAFGSIEFIGIETNTSTDEKFPLKAVGGVGITTGG